MLLALDKDDWWPAEIRARIESMRDVLLKTEYMESLIPVSYTHLGVYKRQVHS